MVIARDRSFYFILIQIMDVRPACGQFAAVCFCLPHRLVQVCEILSFGQKQPKSRSGMQEIVNPKCFHLNKFVLVLDEVF